MEARSSAYPAAYLRRSYVDPDSPGDISREAQRAAVKTLAAKDGHNGNLREYDDWGVSADVSKTAKRTAWAQLLADMEDGKVSAVYAFDVDRLYRDPRDLIRLQDAAAAHRVRVVTTAGELPIGDGDDPTAEAFAFIGAVFGNTELKKAKKRARAAREARRQRGDDLGRPRYGYMIERQPDGRVTFVPNPAEPLEPILAAFEEAGSFSGAARLLNQRRIRTKQGRSWSGNVVNDIVRHERPSLAPKSRSEARVAPRGSHLFSRLLRCHCGRFLTPRVASDYLGYQCYGGRYVEAHGRPYQVSERAMLAWAKDEAARLQLPAAVQIADDGDERRAALIEQKRRIGRAFADGALSETDYADRLAVVDADLAQLDVREEVIDVPPAIEWDRWAPGDINSILRTLWSSIDLDDGMRPVRAEWRLPAEYVR